MVGETVGAEGAALATGLASAQQKAPCVLIADPLAGLRTHATAVVRGLSTAMPHFVEASTGPEAVAMAMTHRPDFVLMEIAMPLMNGIKAAAEIWTQAPDTNILFWTQYHREVYVRDLGRIVPDNAVHGYLLKTHSDEKLKYAIMSVWMHDNPYMDPELRSKQSVVSKDSALTDREYETLQDIALGLTERGIARRRHVSIRGVQCRVASLYRKLVPARYPSDPSLNEMFSVRGLMLLEAIKRGLFDTECLTTWEADLQLWLRDEFAVE
jgi:DNA-binding NarL/FixJ family response regulator